MSQANRCSDVLAMWVGRICLEEEVAVSHRVTGLTAAFTRQTGPVMATKAVPVPADR